ncbi:MAG TPA: glycoside hydrolase family 127 protein, partial [Limnochordia bacterium]|nr:glycoside hydrolase family 127 protein [Limnochordia bacterium]
PNIARLVASVGGYMYSQSETEAYVHLYAAGRARFDFAGQEVALAVATDYPWDGRIQLTVEAEGPVRFGLRLRVPGWCAQATLKVAGQLLNAPTERGYWVVARTWRPGEVVELELAMPVRRVYAHPSVAQDAGQVALMRGPVVYCLEAVDNPYELHRLRLPRGEACTARFEPELLGGVVVVEGDAWCVTDEGWAARLYGGEPPLAKRVRLRAVPYYAWDHRAPGAMRVWLHEGAPGNG